MKNLPKTPCHICGKLLAPQGHGPHMKVHNSVMEAGRPRMPNNKPRRFVKKESWTEKEIDDVCCEFIDEQDRDCLKRPELIFRSAMHKHVPREKWVRQEKTKMYTLKDKIDEWRRVLKDIESKPEIVMFENPAPPESLVISKMDIKLLFAEVGNRIGSFLEKATDTHNRSDYPSTAELMEQARRRREEMMGSEKKTITTKVMIIGLKENQKQLLEEEVSYPNKIPFMPTNLELVYPTGSSEKLEKDCDYVIASKFISHPKWFEAVKKVGLNRCMKAEGTSSIVGALMKLKEEFKL